MNLKQCNFNILPDIEKDFILGNWVQAMIRLFSRKKISWQKKTTKILRVLDREKRENGGGDKMKMMQ